MEEVEDRHEVGELPGVQRPVVGGAVGREGPLLRRGEVPAFGLGHRHPAEVVDAAHRRHAGADQGLGLPARRGFGGERFLHRSPFSLRFVVAEEAFEFADVAEAGRGLRARILRMTPRCHRPRPRDLVPAPTRIAHADAPAFSARPEAAPVDEHRRQLMAGVETVRPTPVVHELHDFRVPLLDQLGADRLDDPAHVPRAERRVGPAAEVAAWVAERNRVQAKIVWTFRVADARRKLDFLYPKELVR